MSILKDLDDLVKKQIISDKNATNIREFYERNPSNNYNRLLLIGGILGGTLISAGIILLFAHNWDFFPKALKLGLSLTPLLISQILLFYGVIKNKSRPYIEGISSFLYISLGAAIGLISQVYHISGDESSFYMLWAFLGLPMVYLVRSQGASIIYTCLITCLCYNTESLISLLFLIPVIPNFIQLIKTNKNGNFTSFHRWILPISILCLIFQLREANRISITFIYFATFSLYYIIGSVETISPNTKAKNGFRVIGLLGILIMLFSLSYHDVWGWIDGFEESNIGLVLSAVMVIGYLTLIGLGLSNQIKLKGPISLLMILPLFGINYMLGLECDFASIITNILLFLISIDSIYKGLNSNSLLKINFGLISILILATLRFFDGDYSIIIRAVLFILAGIGFITTNYFAIKKTKNEN